MDGITADKMIVFDAVNVILLLSSVILQVATWRETRRFCRKRIHGPLDILKQKIVVGHSWIHRIENENASPLSMFTGYWQD